jgi:hypothetical protein
MATLESTRHQTYHAMPALSPSMPCSFPFAALAMIRPFSTKKPMGFKLWLIHYANLCRNVHQGETINQ